MRRIGGTTVLGILTVAIAVTVLASDARWREAWGRAVGGISAQVVAVNIPGASAIAQIGTFLPEVALPPEQCAHPIPTLFSSFIQQGAVLDPNRILVGSRSNFGAPLPISVGTEGSFLSIDPSGSSVLSVPPNFAQSGVQSSALGGAVLSLARTGASSSAVSLVLLAPVGVGAAWLGGRFGMARRLASVNRSAPAPEDKRRA